MSEARVDPNSLPFDPEKQMAVLGHVLYDDQFFSAVITKLEQNWFSDDITGKTYGAIRAWYDKWKNQPTVNELVSSPWVTKFDPLTIGKIHAQTNQAAEARKNFKTGPLLEGMEVWLKARLIQIALPKAAAAFNSHDIEKSVSVLNGMVKDYHDIQFREDGESRFTNYSKDLKEEQIDKSRAVTFGINAIDRILDPNGTKGSLMPGDMTVLLAPTNVGKTSAMVTMAVHNIMQGRAVLFVIHEGTERDLKSKFMRCISKMTIPEILRAYENPEQAQYLKACEAILDKHLTLVPMFEPGLTIEAASARIQRYCEKRRLATGRGYDLLVDDYPAKLTSEQASKGNMQLRNTMELVYNYFVQLALKEDFHVLVAIQTNREGSKVNRHAGSYKHETRLLQMEDVMEAWGPMTAATTVVSLNRDSKDAEKNRLTMLFCKSRSSDTGWAVVCQTDYERCRAFSEELGCFWYRGEENVSAISVDMMKTHKNQLVTSEQLTKYESWSAAGI